MRRLGERLRNGLYGHVEVLAVDMRGGTIFVEGLDENELAWVIHAARPIEPEVARFGSRRFGELVHEAQPPVRPFGLCLELDDDENHGPFVAEITGIC